MTDLRPADPARDACLFLLASFAEPLCAPFLERAVRHLGPDTLRSDPGRVDGALASLTIFLQNQAHRELNISDFQEVPFPKKC